MTLTSPEGVSPRLQQDVNDAVTTFQQMQLYCFLCSQQGLEAQRSHFKKCQKCSEEHIDEPNESVRILSTELFGCITGTRFSLKIYVLNCESEDGVNRYILTPVKAVFTAENDLNRLIILFQELRAV